MIRPILILICVSCLYFMHWGQTPLFPTVQVDDDVFLGSIGDANSTRNVAVAPDGTIHVVFDTGRRSPNKLPVPNRE